MKAMQFHLGRRKVDKLTALNNELDRLKILITVLIENRKPRYEEDKMYKETHEQLLNMIHESETKKEE